MTYPPPTEDPQGRPTGITNWCRLALWFSEYAFLDESRKPMTNERIFGTPMVDNGNGILEMMEQNLAGAVSGGFICQENADRARAAIQRYVAATHGDKRLCQDEMLSKGRRKDSAATNPASLGHVFHELYACGIYMPNNHTDPGKTQEIDNLLNGNGVVRLWDRSGLAGGKTRKFGTYTMRDTYQTALKTLDKILRGAFRDAKSHAILWADPNFRHIPDPTLCDGSVAMSDDGLAAGQENGKCCSDSGGCIESGDPETYCGPTETGECNAWSDPCPA